MADLIRQYNKFSGENKSLIQKALTSATASGEALVPQHLEQTITNALPRLSAALAMITPKFDNQKLHEFNRLTTLPGVGGAMGESAVTPTYQPAFTRASVTMKVVRRKGATTDFLQDSSKRNIDAAAINIEASLLSHVYDLENYIMYGSAGANPYEFTGLDTFVQTNRTNKAVGGEVPTSLKVFDDMIDANMDYQGIGHKKAFVMSPYMLSKLSQLLANVRIQQPLGVVDIAGGWRLNSYRDVPIIVSSACRPKSTMGAVTPTTATIGGTIADGLVTYIRVSAVTRDGEQLACDEITSTAGSSANTNTVILTFTPVTGAFRYKVYVGSESGALTLSRIVPAFTYDSNGTITSSDTDAVGTAGYTTVTSNSSGNVNVITLLNTPTTADAATVPTLLQSDVPLVATDGIAPEYVFFWDLDEYQGLGRLPYTNEGGSRFNGLVTIEDLAKTDDFLPFMIKTYAALADSFEATSGIIRGLRVQ